MGSRNSIIRHGVLSLILPAGVGLLSLLTMACNKPQNMVSTEGVPAAQGTVKATEGDNGNTKLIVHVKHLAPPSRVAADAKVYVVWVQPREGAKQNIGALKLNDNLEGKLETMTPHARFQLFVTPEVSSTVSEPTHDPVFSTEVERSK